MYVDENATCLTDKRFLALLISDALRWTSGDITSLESTAKPTGEPETRTVRRPCSKWVGNADTYVGSFAHLAPCKVLKRRPYLGSDYDFDIDA